MQHTPLHAHHPHPQPQPPHGRPRPPIQHYIKSMCVTLPSDTTVTQASHHGLQALAGLVAQSRNHQSLQVWEHGVLMRERLIYREQLVVGLRVGVAGLGLGLGVGLR